MDIDRTHQIQVYLNGIPMGFETPAPPYLVQFLRNLNGIPMGFETTSLYLFHNLRLKI